MQSAIASASSSARRTLRLVLTRPWLTFQPARFRFNLAELLVSFSFLWRQIMKHSRTVTFYLAAITACAMSTTALAQPHGERLPPTADRRPPKATHSVRPHPGPNNYQRIVPPKGWDNRPHVVNHDAYRHNFRADHGFRVGPYLPPSGWRHQKWVYGQTLPRAYRIPRYVVADYWLFALEVPPIGYEWVRVGNDALLINLANGLILQVVYDLFL